jgi:preprotein translocase subunit SecD
LSGDAVISGGTINNLVVARDLAKQLNLGALPVPVELLSQKKVDATLGADSLNKSFQSGVLGLVAVMIFMVLYYRLPGLLSVFSLAFYAVLNLALFKLIGVTMTLSGIAGFILSIGMAVDANVLVFERLKEELHMGKGLRAATEESFHRSWPSIRDGHITALISCVFLMWFGSGFVQGFATILALGTLINLFTSITVTRTIMRFVFGWFKDRTNWLFLGHRSEEHPN